MTRSGQRSRLRCWRSLVLELAIVLLIVRIGAEPVTIAGDRPRPCSCADGAPQNNGLICTAEDSNGAIDSLVIDRILNQVTCDWHVIWKCPGPATETACKLCYEADITAPDGTTITRTSIGSTAVQKCEKTYILTVTSIWDYPKPPPVPPGTQLTLTCRVSEFNPNYGMTCDEQPIWIVIDHQSFAMPVPH